MKKLIFLIFLHGTFVAASCQAQQIDKIQVLEDGSAVLAQEDYDEILVNNELNFDELFKPGSYKKILNIFGEPEEFEESDNIVQPYKTLKYQGAKFNYTYSNGNFGFRLAEFTSSEFFLSIDGKKIYPGMPVETLKNYIPIAYKRKKDNRIDISKEAVSGSHFFSIYLDPARQEVESIFIMINTM